jgi:hypothetical protein
MSKILNLQRLVLAIAAFAVIAVTSVAASADTITLNTASGAVNNTGNPVNAQVTFTVGQNGALTINLTNLIVNQNDVSQNISDLSFHIDGLTSGALGSNGNTIFVNGDGTTSPGSNNVSTGWVLDGTGPNFHLNGLGTAANVPAYTIIGAPGPGGVYTNANGSIAGNNAHNPFLNQTATFTVTIPGLTSVSQITNVSISFGTTAGDNVPVTNLPEPTTMMLLGTGLLGVAGVARRRFRKS